MTAPNELICFPMWPLAETAMGYYVTASWVPYHTHYVIRSFPLCGANVLHPARMIYLDRQLRRPPKKQTNKKPACTPGVV